VAPPPGALIPLPLNPCGTGEQKVRR
jgi:hypothetical protein